MEYLLIAVVLAAVFAFLALPILNPPREEKPESDALDALLAQRDSAYQAIRDLDFDFQLGNLAQGEYQTLREKYKVRAAAVLQEMDAMRATSAEPIAPSAPEHETNRYCTNCGTPRDHEDKFCRKCGNKLP